MTETAFLPLQERDRWMHPSPFRRIARVPDSAADLTRRGVTPPDPVRAVILESIAHRFLAGYNAMLEARPFARLDAVLAETEPARHGFVVEGAAMGAAIRDGLSLRGGLLETLGARHGARFEYLMSVGAGWAIARMPWRRGRILSAFDPLLGALACDGHGFHDLYFHPRKAETGAISRYAGERARSYDEGLGRALWFIASGTPERLDTLLGRFAPERRLDMLSGVGLAMAYAGPSAAQDWAVLRTSHAAHWAHVGQGVCFAAEAMRRCGQMPEHTTLACHVALGRDPDAAADIAAETRPAGVTPERAAEAYRAWRAAIRDRLAAEPPHPEDAP